MSQTQVQQLVRMAHQIALNLAAEGDAAAGRAADHICRFWTPTMRRLLVEHGRACAGDLPAPVREVVEILDER